MLKGGVIMDVVTPEHARIAEEAGACAVMALERVPADIRAHGGVARMSDPELIVQIMDTVTIPVMAKCRIGHFVEAQVLEALGVDYIDESEVLTPADEENHIFKHPFKIPFVCGCRNLGEALRRIGEGAALIRTKGEAGSGDIVEGVRHLRAVQTPRPVSGHTHVYHQYTVRVPPGGDRDAVVERLNRRGVGARVYYPTPIHAQPVMQAKHEYGHVHLPETDQAVQEVLSLPVYPGLTEDELAHIVQEVNAAC